MGEEYSISCPQCGAVFDITVDMAGLIGECAECQTEFIIPTEEELNSGFFKQPQDASPPETQKTPTGPISTGRQSFKSPAQPEDEGNIGETTRTVKLSRTGVGMIPEVQDKFKVDVKQTSTSVSIKKEKQPPPKEKSPTSPGNKRQTPQKTVKKTKKSFWSFLKFWKK